MFAATKAELVVPKKEFSGTWIRDRSASDSMAGVASLMGLGTLMRQAVKLAKGLEIQHHPDSGSISVGVFSVVEWFKFTEHYALDGSESKCKRRDFRRGTHTARMSCPSPGKLVLHGSWGEPFAGSGVEEMEMPAPDVLHVCSHIRLDNGQSCKYKMVYRRRM